MRSVSPPMMSGEGGAMVFDMARGRSVMVARGDAGAGSMETWEWDGLDWQVRQPTVVPPGRFDPALAFDALRARMVLFGGANNDTWEWDGVAWLQRFPAAAPSPRGAARMAFDIARGRTWLFGGKRSDQSVSDETWEWDGVNWTQRQPVTRPPARYRQGMAYDLSRNRIVMFGGGDANDHVLFDTWEWDGSNWTQRFPVHTPNAIWLAMAYDPARARTLLYTGTTWTWDGIDWTQLSPPTSPSVGSEVAGIAADILRQRTVLHGSTGVHGSPVTWEWDGSTWTEVRSRPVGRAFAAMAYADARGSTLLFGGSSGGSGFGGVTHYNDTWEWDGASWSERMSTIRPGPRAGAAIAYDGRRDRFVLFGGGQDMQTASAVVFGDTWELDRANWIPRVTSPSPPARTWHAMAFDPSRGRVVLFGGNVGALFLAAVGDTWEWDGSSWTQLAPALAPAPRLKHAMTFDPVRGRVLLFGGTRNPPIGVMNDTWEWDGSSWQQRAPATAPPVRYGHCMTWDVQRARTVVFGGTDLMSHDLADTWEWDGVNWTPVAPATSPLATTYAVAAYDSQRGAHVVFGGQRGWNPLESGELWEYATPGFAIASKFGSGCGAPPLTASPAAGSRPILGATQTIDISNVPAGFAAMAYGFSMSAPLPLDLRFLGMTGCSLLQSADSLFEACASSGPATATYSASVPNLPSLLSLRVWLQAWAPAPGQNPAGLIASNAVSLLLGSQ